MSERLYEILFIADPNLGEPEVDALTSRSRGSSSRPAARSRRSRSGARSASPTRSDRHRDGSYVLLAVEGGGGLVKEVERRLKVTDGIIRFLTVRVDEELRKAERRKAKRALGEEKRRGGRGPAAAPSHPAPEAEGVQQ